MTAKQPLTLLYLWVILLGFGVIAVASVSVHLADSWLNSMFLRHLVYVALSGAALLLAYRIPTERYSQFHRAAWLVAVVLAALVLMPGIGVESGGGRRWISFHFFTIQVSEIVKPLLLIFIAGYVGVNYERIQRSMMPLLTLLFSVGLVLGLIFLEPDFGTVAIMGTVAVGVLFLAKARLSHLFVLGGIAMSGIAALLYVEPYRVTRLVTLLSPWEEGVKLNEGYQLTNSLIGFGRGEFTGTGLGTGLQKTFTPASHNDFIFATIAEETGVIGASVVLGLLMALVYKISNVARTALRKDRHFESMFCYGAALLIGFQALIHVGVNAGIFPTKGLTLPFISYGGNSLLILSALIGMVLRIDQSNEVDTLK